MKYHDRFREYYKGKYSFKYQSLGKYIYFILLFALLLYVLKLTGILEFNSIAFNVSQFINILNSLFTLGLLIVTTLYVIYTKKIVTLTKANAQTELIPKIWLFLEGPKIAPDLKANDIEITFTLKVSNFGKTPVISSNLSLTIPVDPTVSKNSQFQFRKSWLDKFPKVLDPFSSTEHLIKLNAPIDYNNIEVYRKSFLELKLMFEDVDRNLHIITQIHDLDISHFDIAESIDRQLCHWNILFDEHFYILRENRNFVHDNSSTWVYSASGNVLVYRKINHFAAHNS